MDIINFLNEQGYISYLKIIFNILFLISLIFWWFKKKKVWIVFSFWTALSFVTLISNNPSKEDLLRYLKYFIYFVVITIIAIIYNIILDEIKKKIELKKLKKIATEKELALYKKLDHKELEIIRIQKTSDFGNFLEKKGLKYFLKDFKGPIIMSIVFLIFFIITTITSNYNYYLLWIYITYVINFFVSSIRSSIRNKKFLELYFKKIEEKKETI